MAETRKNDVLLEVKDLKVHFQMNEGLLKAVDGVDLTVREGRTLGIVGESGSGKSTVARLITGLLPCSEGEILFFVPEKTNGSPGEEGSWINITQAGKRELRSVYRHMQMVFQTPAESFDPRRTLGDGIGESLRNMGIKGLELKKRVDNLLELCGLSPEFALRYPHQVSGGQCQRAAIARALAVEPQLLICDEATSALDMTVQKQIMELLMKLKKEQNLSVIFICHDLALVQMFCDRVLVMEQGRIVETGTPDQVIHTPREEYTRILVDAVFDI